MGLNTTPATWVSGSVPPALQFNTEIRDALMGIQAAWDTYVPSWTSSGTAPALGNGTISGSYIQIGKTVDFIINLTPGTTTTFGTGNYSFSIPFASSAGLTHVGNAQLLIGAARWPGQALISPGVSTCQPFLATSSTDPRLTQMTPTAPGTFANGNSLRIQGRYQAA